MKTHFYKMHHLKNHFIIFDFQKNENKISNLFQKLFDSKFIIKICSVDEGIGADGIIYLLNSKNKKLNGKMLIFNSDGSQASMCGNGLACISKLIFEKLKFTKNTINIETLSGIKKVTYNKVNDNIEIIVNIGKPKIIDKYNIKVDNKNFEGYFISTGNPHFVILLDNPLTYDEILKIGPIIENYHYFKDKTNVEFVTIKSKDFIKVDVWERGVGITKACGTGTAASSFLVFNQKLCNNLINVELLGGNFKVQIKNNSNEVYLHCNPIKVFNGWINIEKF